MIYEQIADETALSQSDIIDDCPILSWKATTLGATEHDLMNFTVRAVVLTQACDVAQGKSERTLIAVVHQAQPLVQLGILKPAMIRDQIRTHRVYGWYFLPAGDAIPESLVDLRDLHTVPRAILERLIAEGKRRCRVVTPYREHMAQHFATTYSRIALPEPYGTEP